MNENGFIKTGEFEGSRLEFSRKADHHDTDTHYYEEFFAIDLKELAGKKVLDIGGEPEGDFANAAKENNVDLISLNPSQDHLSFFRDYSDEFKNVAGLAQELPFADKSFDLELSMGSVPAFLPQYESEYRAMFTEMLRVLKDDGSIRIYPILGTMREEPVFQKILEELGEEAEFEFKFVEKSAVEYVLHDFYRLIITKKHA